MLHHSLTKDGTLVNWQNIRNYHMGYRIDGKLVSMNEYNERLAKGQGLLFQSPWSDIGYHFGVENVDDEYEVLIGRPLTRNGAHCKGVMNRDAIGICFVGNYDIFEPSTTMLLVAIHRLIIPLMKIFNIDSDHIIGHRQIASYKSCPGKKFNMGTFKNLVETELNNG